MNTVPENQMLALRALAPDFLETTKCFCRAFSEFSSRVAVKEGTRGSDWMNDLHALHERAETLIGYYEAAVVPIRVRHLEANSFTLTGGPLIEGGMTGAARVTANPDGWSLEFEIDGFKEWFSFQKLRQDQVVEKLLTVLSNHGHDQVVINQVEIEKHMDIVLERLCTPPEKAVVVAD